MPNFGPIQRRRNRSGSDSSSSDGSSRERPPAPRRPISPAQSDDGDANMEPVENDDTPPPASRPLLRQAVAFVPDKPPPSISTYEAVVPENIPEADRFLPGQQVAVPGLETGDRGDKHAKVKKRQEAYPGQTTKFRLNTSYDPKFIITTPHDKGEGAQYRNLNRSPPLSGYEDSIANAALLNNQNPDTSGFRKPRKPRGPNKPKQQHTLEAMVIDLTPATDPKNAKESPAKKQDRWLYIEADADASSSTATKGPDKGQESTSSTGTYYRRDYEADRAAQRSESPGHSSSYYRTRQDRAEQRQMEKKDKEKDKAVKSKRMTTILISDTRSGSEDLQLVEVMLPLKDAAEGYWADAQDIGEAIQSGPWRIDGPARAYVLRGKYRQIILRVSAENKDEYLSTNVAVKPDRTLDLAVELLPQHGAPPPPPKVPTELIEPDYANQSPVLKRSAVPEPRSYPDGDGRPKGTPEPSRPGYIAPFATSSMGSGDSRPPQPGREPRQMQVDEPRHSHGPEVPPGMPYRQSSNEGRPYPPGPGDPRQGPPPAPGPGSDPRQYPGHDPRQGPQHYDPRMHANGDPRMSPYYDPRQYSNIDPRRGPPPPGPPGAPPPGVDPRQYPGPYHGPYPGMMDPRQDPRQYPGSHAAMGGEPRPYPMQQQQNSGGEPPRPMSVDPRRTPTIPSDSRKPPHESQSRPSSSADPRQQYGKDSRQPPVYESRQAPPPDSRQQIPIDPRLLGPNESRQSSQSNGDPRRHRHTHSDTTMSDRMDVDAPRHGQLPGPPGPHGPAPPPSTYPHPRDPREPQDLQRRTSENSRDPRKRINDEAFDDYDGPGSQTPVLAKAPRYEWQNSPRQNVIHASPKAAEPGVAPGPPKPPGSRVHSGSLSGVQPYPGPQAYSGPPPGSGRLVPVDPTAPERTRSSSSDNSKKMSAPERMPERPPWERPSPSPKSMERPPSQTQRPSRDTRESTARGKAPQERERMPEAPPWERGPEKPSKAERQAALDRANEHPHPPSRVPLPPRSPSPKAQPMYATRSDHPNEEQAGEKESSFITDLGKALAKEKSFRTFFQSQGKNRIQDIVIQYKYVGENPLLGKRLDGWETLVEERHIIEALKITSPDFKRNYKESLHLLSLYGPKERHENAEVVALLNDEKPVGPSGNPHKRLVHLLRKVEQENAKGGRS